jgi:hypothetical protein
VEGRNTIFYIRRYVSNIVILNYNAAACRDLRRDATIGAL